MKKGKKSRCLFAGKGEGKGRGRSGNPWQRRPRKSVWPKKTAVSLNREKGEKKRGDVSSPPWWGGGGKGRIPLPSMEREGGGEKGERGKLFLSVRRADNPERLSVQDHRRKNQSCFASTSGLEKKEEKKRATNPLLSLCEPIRKKTPTRRLF